MLGPLENVLAQAQGRLLREDREQLAVARRNALRLLKLVNTLLDFSRLEAGRAQALYEPTDLCRFYRGNRQRFPVRDGKCRLAILDRERASP